MSDDECDIPIEDSNIDSKERDHGKVRKLNLDTLSTTSYEYPTEFPKSTLSPNQPFISSIIQINSSDNDDPNSSNYSLVFSKTPSFKKNKSRFGSFSFIKNLSGYESTYTDAAPSKKYNRRDIWTSPLSVQTLKSAQSRRLMSSSCSYYSQAHKPNNSNYNIPHPLERHTLKITNFRNLSKSLPSKAFSYEFDYAIVFPLLPNCQQSFSTKYILHTILLAGLEIYPFLSVQDDELYALIRCPLPVLQNIAEKSGFKILADSSELKSTLYKGNPDKRIAPVKIKHDPDITPLDPYENVYLKYQNENNMSLYYTKPTESTPFSKSIRLKLIHHLLISPKRLGGCNLDMNRLLLRNEVLSFFPLHEPAICHDILNKCIAWNVMPWEAPIEDLKDYLGEKIALYNVFLGHLSYWMIPLAVIGVVFQIIVLHSSNYSTHPVLPVFSVIVIFWTIITLAFWKRQQSKTALQWGTTDFVEQQSDRPEFKGEYQYNSHINGREMLYFPKHDFRKRLGFSIMSIFSFVLLVIGVITAIYVLRFSLQSNLGKVVNGIASLLNVGEILIMNMVYQQIAISLTNQENHRTDTQYEDALIIKVFVFQFVNSYASLFFLAFIAASLPRPSYLADTGEEGDYIGQCGDTTCMRPLALNLFVIIAARMVFKNLMDMVMPFLGYWYNSLNETKGIKSNKLLSPPELDFMLMKYDSILENVRKYSDTVIQYGYTILFIAALPCAPFMTLIYSYLKMKFQALKLLTLYQRPIPVGAQSIESWQYIYDFILLISMVTNAGIICYSMDIFQKRSYSFKVWVFVGFQWTMVIIMLAAHFLIPQEPEEVLIQKARISFISQKIIDKYEDDDYDEIICDYESDEEEEHKHLVPDEETGRDLESGNLQIHMVRGVSNASTLGADAISEIVDFKQEGSGSEKIDDSGKGLKRSTHAFYKPNENTKKNLIQNIAQRLPFTRESHIRQLSKRVMKEEKKEKKKNNRLSYRRNELHDGTDTFMLEPIEIFEYPDTDEVNCWRLPLVKENVDNQNLDILKLNI